MLHTTPLVLNITNSVTIEFVANSLLALGASPVMSEDPEDTVELANLANSICINIGTIHLEQEKQIFRLLNTSIQKPIVLDPVGAGATKVRTNIAHRILETNKITLVRGNASEILSLTGESSTTRGVDSSDPSLRAKDSAVQLAKKINGIVVVSGEIDFVTDGKNIFSISNGSSKMAKITGSGCVLSAYLAAVLGEYGPNIEKVGHAVAFFGYFGEVAAKESQSLGTFRQKFLDAMSQENFNECLKFFKIQKEVL